MRAIIIKSSGVILGLLGLISLFMTTSVIFDLFGIRTVEGNYVSIVVYANFICAFLYLFASYCFFTNNKNASPILIVASIILIIGFAALMIHIQDGGVYEMKTVRAMTFRTLITLFFTGISVYYFQKKGRSAVVVS
ncbi:MAG: hypothetical protein ABI123_02285 [Ginsengibacter sp.]